MCTDVLSSYFSQTAIQFFGVLRNLVHDDVLKWDMLERNVLYTAAVFKLLMKGPLIIVSRRFSPCLFSIALLGTFSGAMSSILSPSSFHGLNATEDDQPVGNVLSWAVYGNQISSLISTLISQNNLPMNIAAYGEKGLWWL